MDDRLIHYEGMNDVADIDSRMYPSIESMIEQDRQDRNKPFFLCEYAHAMGNAVGNLEEYWDYIENHSNRMIGGCIWDWVDQGINMPGQSADRYYFGGSFGDYPNDNDFCCNGLITPDRRVTAKLWEVKKVYQYITFDKNGENSIGLRNRYCVYNLHDFNLRYTLLKNGVPFREEEFSLPDGKPGEHRAVQVLYERYLTEDADYHINLEVKLKEDCVWAKAGHVVATEQFELKKGSGKDIVPAQQAGAGGEIKVVEEREHRVYFRGNAFEVAFDSKEGKMTALRYHGKNMIHQREGWAFNGYRSISNDPREWMDSQKELTFFQWEMAEDRQSATVTVQLVEKFGKQDVAYSVSYRIHGDGKVLVDASFQTGPGFDLPRLSLQSFLNPELENIEWYGRGPIENYPDRKNAAYIGRYKSTVADMGEYYTRSQTMGGRTDTRWVALTADNGKGLKITSADVFSFSALHYTDRDLWEVKYGHDLEDVRRSEVVLNLDCVQRGLGNASCGPGPRPQYEIKKDTLYRYSFCIEPVE